MSFMTKRYGLVRIVEEYPVRQYSRNRRMQLVRIVCDAFPESVNVRRYRIAKMRGGAL